MESTPRPAPSGAAAAVDYETIRASIRQATERGPVPTRPRIEHLAQRLRGHLALLLGEDLGDDDYELRCMRREAEQLLKAPDAPGPRPQAWTHVGILGYAVKGLLRRYSQAHPASGPARVGDKVRDEAAGRDAYVTDVDGAGRCLLRPLHGLGETYAKDPARLTILVRREDRTDL